MLDLILEFVNNNQYAFDVVFIIAVLVLVLCDIRTIYRRHVGKDIVITPQLTLFTDNGDKIHVLSVNDEQGRYVLYHSRDHGLKLATHREFMKIKGDN